MADKTEADAVAQLTDAERTLAQIRAPKVEATLVLLEELAARMPDLVAQRDALHEGQAKLAIGHVISILTSAPGMVRAEIATLNAVRGEA